MTTDHVGVAGQTAAPSTSHYGAAAAGVIDLTATLGHEWTSDGVRVDCIAPGIASTVTVRGVPDVVERPRDHGRSPPRDDGWRRSRDDRRSRPSDAG